MAKLYVSSNGKNTNQPCDCPATPAILLISLIVGLICGYGSYLAYGQRPICEKKSGITIEIAMQSDEPMQSDDPLPSDDRGSGR